MSTVDLLSDSQLACGHQPSTSDDLLQHFCDSGVTRYSFESPFVKGGFEYATDARIAVRRATEKPDVDFETRRLPFQETMEALFAFPEHLRFSPLPDPEYAGNCDCCGSGVIRCECCDHEKPCNRCCGTGAEKSWIGRYSIGVRLDRKIRSLPSVEFASWVERESIIFRSVPTGIVGVVAANTRDDGKIEERAF